jgi:hypothetical protein
MNPNQIIDISSPRSHLRASLFLALHYNKVVLRRQR